MNILIVGGGHLGRCIAEELDEQGHDIVLIEEREDKLNLLNSKFGGVVFNLFPMDINNLREAGIENCDAVAVTTSDDNLNIIVGQIARNVFNIKMVVSRISDPKRETIYEDFGLKTVCPTNMASKTIISTMLSPQKQNTINFGTNTVSFNKVEADKRHIGRRMNNIVVKDDEMLFGLIRSSGRFLLNIDYDCPRVEPGDTLVFSQKID